MPLLSIREPIKEAEIPKFIIPMRNSTKLLSSILAAAVVCFTALAVQSGQQRSTLSKQEITKKRAERHRATKAPMAAPARVNGGTNGDKPLYGMHIEAYDGILSGYSGPAQIDASGNHVKLMTSNFEKPVFSGCYFDGTYFAIHYNEGASTISYRFYDAETWENTGALANYVSNNPDRLASALTYDPVTKKIYGMFYKDPRNFSNTNDAQLGTINMDDAMNPVEIIGDMGVRMRGMAAAADGTMYGVAYDGTVYSINKHTASVTEVSKITYPEFPDAEEIGIPQFSWYYGTESAVIDWETGDMYMLYSDSNGDTFIIKIVPTTGATTLVANYGYWTGGTETCNLFTGLFFKQTFEESGSIPGPVSDLNVTPVGIELKADVTFKMPAEDADGKTLEGMNLSYLITDGENELATGDAPAGETVYTTVPVTAAGKINFVVTAVNGREQSSPVSKMQFIGPDEPVISTAPIVFPNGQQAQVRWGEAYALNNGNLGDPVYYKVVRTPGDVVVAEATTETTVTDNIQSTIKQLYTYTVTPTAGGVTGQTVNSRGTYLGSVFDTPYQDSFEQENLFNEYPQIDGNKDSNYWWIDATRGRAVYSSTELDADDYLLIGPFDLTGGDLYVFSMTAGGHSILEHIDAYVGTDPNDKSSFATNIIPRSQLNPNIGDSRLAGTFLPESDGRYYFAIHACSDANHKNIYVFDVSVSKVSKQAPAAPVITAIDPRAASVKIDFTLPSLTISGDRAGCNAVRIYRDNALLTEITEGVADGATLSYEDTDNVTDGMHTYAFAAVNAMGQGESKVIDVYRGLDKPGSPSNLKIREDLNTPGLMHLSWTAPTVGMNGGYINPDDVRYLIDYALLGGSAGLVSDIQGTSYDLRLDNPTKQGLISASVYGSNAAGAERRTWITESAHFGPALSIPLRESWPDMTQKSGIWRGDNLFEETSLFESMWDISDGSQSGITPQDNDGGMTALRTNVDGRGYRIYSPRVDISNAQNPTLVFYYYYSDNAAEFRTEILVDDKPLVTLSDIDLTPANTGKWIRKEIPLSAYKNSKYIQVAFAGVAVKAAQDFICIDNISISDLINKDLAVNSFEAPVKTGANEQTPFILSIRNNGSDNVAASDYTIALYKNGEIVAEQPGVDIDSDMAKTFEFVDIPTVADPASTEYYAEIIYEADGNPENNTSSRATIRVVAPVYPRVKDLKAENTDGVTLTWSDPSASDMPNTPSIESFETYTAFTTTDLGEWTLHDGDEAPTVILQQSMGVLNYPNIGTPMAWQVIDPYEANIFSFVWEPRTGNNMLVSFQACVEGTRNIASDDWLISPELYGGAQNISFFARAGMRTEVDEIVDILYSTTGNNPDDFKTLSENVVIGYTDDWTEYNYDLPEGTRYFAIVHKTYGGLAVLIDDLTYVPAGSTSEVIELRGYNIYRDGKKVNDVLIGDNTWTDPAAVRGEQYTYAVSTVWDKGESGLSNEVTVTASTSVQGLNAPEYNIHTIPGGIRVKGADGCILKVYSMTGVCVATRRAGEVEDIALPAGTYVVLVDNNATKAIVR